MRKRILRALAGVAPAAALVTAMTAAPAHAGGSGATGGGNFTACTSLACASLAYYYEPSDALPGYYNAYMSHIILTDVTHGDGIWPQLQIKYKNDNSSKWRTVHVHGNDNGEAVLQDNESLFMVKDVYFLVCSQQSGPCKQLSKVGG
ncbi:hypothetical protein PV721_01085 [Streptomyces sp. MB09-01]|uniref:hypothetical protein n=1 Tax=Streptomyces sp. MB09-01 TaxID=3028666 RepID=UPI0029BF7F64|nr:hypothetical protein [Streptomyces sp. MB09-01]MDX3532990.1 hypothetical protein [Streptomyces sp. MB09-01]